MGSRTCKVWKSKDPKECYYCEELVKVHGPKGMLLLWRVDGSSSFYKGLGLAKFESPWTFWVFPTLLVLGPLQKLLLPLTFRSNVPFLSRNFVSLDILSHLYFGIMEISWSTMKNIHKLKCPRCRNEHVCWNIQGDKMSALKCPLPKCQVRKWAQAIMARKQ